MRSEPRMHVSAEGAALKVVFNNRAFFFYKKLWRKGVGVYALKVWVCCARSVMVRMCPRTRRALVIERVVHANAS